MTLRFGRAGFMFSYSVAYALVLAKKWPLFVYYPLHDNFNWGPKLLKGIGPAMTWYGLIASACLIAVFVAFVVPDRVFVTAFRNNFWLFPAATILLAAFLFRRLFLY